MQIPDLNNPGYNLAEKNQYNVKQVAEYVQRTELDDLMKEMLNSLLYEQPDDPRISMIYYLAKTLDPLDLEREGIKLDKEMIQNSRNCPIIKDYVFSENSTLILKRFLNSSVYDKLKSVKTKFGGCIAHIIDAANKIEGKETVGLYATDNDCYDKMKPLFQPSVEFLHTFDPEKSLFSCSYDFGLEKKIDHSDKLQNYLNFRVKLSRNIGLPYNPHALDITKQEVEKRILNALQSQFKNGKYYHIDNQEFTKLKDAVFDKELNFISAGCNFFI